MPTYGVKVLDVDLHPCPLQDLLFLMPAENYGEAVIAVGMVLELERIPYRCFAGSKDWGR